MKKYSILPSCERPNIAADYEAWMNENSKAASNEEVDEKIEEIEGKIIPEDASPQAFALWNDFKSTNKRVLKHVLVYRFACEILKREATIEDLKKADNFSNGASLESLLAVIDYLGSVNKDPSTLYMGDTNTSGMSDPVVRQRIGEVLERNHSMLVADSADQSLEMKYLNGFIEKDPKIALACLEELVKAKSSIADLYKNGYLFSSSENPRAVLDRLLIKSKDLKNEDISLPYPSGYSLSSSWKPGRRDLCIFRFKHSLNESDSSRVKAMVLNGRNRFSQKIYEAFDHSSKGSHEKALNCLERLDRMTLCRSSSIEFSTSRAYLHNSALSISELAACDRDWLSAQKALVYALVSSPNLEDDKYRNKILSIYRGLVKEPEAPKAIGIEVSMDQKVEMFNATVFNLSLLKHDHSRSNLSDSDILYGEGVQLYDQAASQGNWSAANSVLEGVFSLSRTPAQVYGAYTILKKGLQRSIGNYKKGAQLPLFSLLKASEASSRILSREYPKMGSSIQADLVYFYLDMFESSIENKDYPNAFECLSFAGSITPIYPCVNCHHKLSGYIVSLLNSSDQMPPSDQKKLASAVMEYSSGVEHSTKTDSWGAQMDEVVRLVKALRSSLETDSKKSDLAGRLGEKSKNYVSARITRNLEKANARKLARDSSEVELN